MLPRSKSSPPAMPVGEIWRSSDAALNAMCSTALGSVGSPNVTRCWDIVSSGLKACSAAASAK